MAATILSVIALIVSAVAAGFAYYQAQLLKKQIQLQAIMDLDREWRSNEMLQERSSFWSAEGHPDQDRAEDVLEFLEKVSSFEEGGIIECRLVWDTLGWYMVRYHHYCQNVIEILRERWTHRRDHTLYQDLEKLSDKLLREEANKQRISADAVQEELDDKDLRKKFVESERSLIHE